MVELIEGKPFDAVLRDRIFGPASMATASGETGQQLMPQRALPHRLAASTGAVVVASALVQASRFSHRRRLGLRDRRRPATVRSCLATGVFGAAGKTRTAESGDQTWRSWYGRTDGYEASVDLLPAADLTFVFLSNLRSAANWQLREQVKSMLQGRKAAAIFRSPPPLASSFEAPDALLGSYGDPSDPVVIAMVDGHLFRDDSEFYPIADGRYYIPASGSAFRFRRTSDGIVDGMVTVSPWADTERLALRVPGRQ